jgi:two-component system, sensor histidine kinase and response regulator
MVRFSRLLLLSLVATLFGTAIYLTFLIRDREESLSEFSRYNLQWSASQAAIELTRLQVALSAAAMPDSTTTADDVRLRFDILKNRLNLLSSGEFKTFANLNTETSAIVSESLVRLAIVAPVLDRLKEPHAAQRALDQLTPLTGKFVTLAAYANRYGGERVAEDQAELKSLHRLFSAMLVGLILIGAGLSALMFRHNRLLSQTHARLEKTAVDLREASIQADAANKAKSEFLAKMSHEIRTPMNGVLGMTEILINSDLSERQTRLLGTIRKSGNSLLAIINDILDLSRIEAGQLTVEDQEFDLRQHVESSVELLAEQAFRKGVELTLYVDDRIPDRLRGDGGRLQQVCVNLVGNAIKFTEKGGVDLHVAPIQGDDGQPRIHFQIRDSGIGIDAATQARLFKPFIQADNSISRKFGGTGLGLSISRHIVEMLGGKIALESLAGKGTLITFSIPLRAASGLTVQTRADWQVLAGARILVVDDRAPNREIAAAYLKTCGAVVDQATDTQSAFERIEDAHRTGHPFQVIVADRLMPGQNGFALASKIKSLEKYTPISVILLMAMTSQDRNAASPAADVQRVLTKPLRRDDLLNAVSECLLTRRDIRSAKTPQQQPAKKTSGRFSAHLLVAEDNPVNVEVAIGYLEAFGCTFDVVDNGAEAIRAFEKKEYDLIFMDYHMPEVDGLTATREIRARETLLGKAQVPIIAVTANAFPEDQARCIAAGMNDYLSKPFFEEQFAGMLEKWLPRAQDRLGATRNR